jgi:putative intracellular protease/amidase
MKKILVIATNIDKYKTKELKTGLWLGEYTHFYDIAVASGFQCELVSIAGGTIPIDPESLGFFVKDKSITNHNADASFMNTMINTKSIDEINPDDYAAIYLTGGHGTMYDFVGNNVLNQLIQTFFETNKVVAAVCHGCCGLLDVKLSNGVLLIENKNVTGYSWFEETLAFRKSAVPFNLQQKMIDRKANYKKGFFPLTPFVQVDGKLVTGQNPFSTKAVAKAVVTLLKA